MAVPGMSELAGLRHRTNGLTNCYLAEVAADAAARRVTLQLLDIPAWNEATQQQGVWTAEILFSNSGASWVPRGSAVCAGASAPASARPVGEGVRLDLIASRLEDGRLTLDAFYGPSLRIVFGSAEVRTGPTTWMDFGADEPVVLHATTVAWDGRAVLIRGASGSGKSALGLELLAWGCRLLADDRTELRRKGDRLVARCPPAIRGLIEARGVGLLHVEALEEAEIAAIVDLGHQEAERLPPWREETILGVRLPVLHKPLNGPFAAAILQYLKGGRAAPAPEADP